MRSAISLAILLLSLLSVSAVRAAEVSLSVPPAATVKQPQGSEIIPERFLRRWDPVTLFFKRRVGPAQATPEDHPERYVTLSPNHPGAFTWLNETTLQFNPAEPWPPLSRYTWQLKRSGRSHSLITLMEPPVYTLPADGARDLQPVESITLGFSEPLNPEQLAQMVKIELRPLPGVGGGASRWLDQEDFKIKVMEREKRSDQAVYVLLLSEPIPGGIQAVVNLRLSLADDVEQAFKRIAFSTAAPFRVARFGCANSRYPTAPGGISYTREQAIQCSAANPQVEVVFSAPLAELNPIAARNLVRFTPAVEHLEFSVQEELLTVRGDFKADTLYRFSLQPSPLRDRYGRSLEVGGESELYLHFPPRHPFLAWESSQGIVERYGPQMVPLRGRGFGRLDLRIYPLDPLDRSFWPFPPQPVVVDESARPPGPGETPAPFSDAERQIAPHQLSAQISALGSPAISELVELPLARNGAAAKFGLDLKEYLSRIQGRDRPGSYLVGIRALDDSSHRSWIRIQVTDLSLSVIEERHSVRFVVTSLKSGEPVSRAGIELEGSQAGKWASIASGQTGSDGAFTWQVPARSGGWSNRMNLKRILVSKGDDRLVLDPAAAPDQYQDNLWSKSHRSWLDWTGQSHSEREPAKEELCHIFTERPVYKPDEPVHIKGYARQRHKNRLSIQPYKGTLLLQGPGDREWRYPVTLSEHGSFYHKFDEAKLPTGSYSATFEIDRKGQCGSVTFRKEAYRIPRFEVNLNAPDEVAMDQAFKVRLSSRYYAGGQVAGQPVRWRVTQFPYTWTPQAREGFYFSTDGRFSGREAFRASPVIRREALTDADGSAEIELNPAIEATAQPRSYVIEATVVGADDQTVSNTRRVLALPPLVLGLKAPRYLKKADSVTPEIIAVGPDGALMKGQEIKLKLSKRQWHSHLQATDFSSGGAKYVTEVVDEPISEATLVSADQPLQQPLKLQGAGVYIIEIESQDRLGRAQVVSVDFYAGGDEPVTWSRPPSKVFKVTPDASRYAPGETARLVLESPFQNARALAILEGPEGNRYDWLELRNGSATYELPVAKAYTPRVPVHFLLMRGRMGEDPAGSLDLGKPATLAATAWVEVEPVENSLDVALEHRPKAQPGEELEVTVRLSDNSGRPLAGEVTLWLVDQAVLALGKEQRLELLPDFITAMPSQMVLRDTRNLALGYLPFEEQPGGGAQEGEAKSKLLEDNVTVRKNFQSVPYFNPAIAVGSDGVARVRVKLPDNLTQFKLRAKAVSGEERFGFAKSQVAVRLPVIVQPSLPRFVRPGDSFVATAIGRIVEGEGGPGRAQALVSGLQLEGEATQNFEWQAERPQRIDFKLRVPDPGYDEQGRPSYEEVAFTGAVERSGDQARDAFEVKLPLRADRRPVVERVIAEVTPAEALGLPAVTQAVRPGTLKRYLLLSDQPGLIRMAGGLNYLLEYPHGCTEQRLSRARAYLALDRFRGLLYDDRSDEELKQSVNQTLEWIESVVDGNGLAAYWPGSKGYVSLTAWVVQFMVEARKAGYAVNETLFDRMTGALGQALRSDYRRFIDGEAYSERSMALWALAVSGKIDKAYAAELARKADYLNLEAVARVVRVLRQQGAGESAMGEKLSQRLWNGLVFRLYQGNEIYGGLQENAVGGNRLILPSETRTLAEVVRTLETGSGDKARLQILVDGLVTLGAGDGWGSTNATSAALLALSDFMAPEGPLVAEQQLEVELDGKRQQLTLGGKARLLKLHGEKGDPVEVRSLGDTAGRPLVVRAETRYLPADDGSRVEPRSKGFVVNRELLQVQSEGEPPKRIPLTQGAQRIELRVGDVIEDHVALVNAEERTFVAVVVPLAAGMEPLNPHLATAPAEAKPANPLTREPSYTAYLDDRVAFYYDSLPRGNYHFYFRTRAAIRGEFIQPAAYAELMYEEAVSGNSAGARVVIQAEAEEQGSHTN